MISGARPRAAPGRVSPDLDRGDPSSIMPPAADGSSRRVSGSGRSTAMRGRRRLFAIVVLASALHGVGIARTILPAQDGLKFIRAARQFQVESATDVIRSNDQHPLHPGLVALAEPVVRAFAGPGPDTWRVAAQAVAATASIVLLVPL